MAMLKVIAAENLEYYIIRITITFFKVVEQIPNPFAIS